MGLALGLGWTGHAAGQTSSATSQVVQCDQCHANRDFLAANAVGPGLDTALYVPAVVTQGTAHQTLSCADCHVGFDAGYPHQFTEVVADCSSCHEQEGNDWSESIHAGNAETTGDAPTCVDCHTAHRVLSASDPESPTYALNVAGLCSRCHADPAIIGRYFVGSGNEQAEIAAAAFPESVHGIALTRDGLVVSATCSDCHSAHRVLPSDDQRSTVSRANIPTTCGACHAGIVRVFDASAHGPDYPEEPGDENPHERPVCVDCHSAHEISRTDQPAWRLGTVQTCGSCHEELYETYFETYHGQVAQLGFDLAAKCEDCHTAHDMRPASDPASTVFAGNIIETCGQCHEGSNANFVKYYAHGDHTQRTRFPVLYWSYLFMTTLLVSVMSFFLLHSGLWVVRERIDRWRDRKSAGEAES